MLCISEGLGLNHAISVFLPWIPFMLCLSFLIRKRRSSTYLSVVSKRIQDTLTSKKTLAKECEQLVIQFGDADTGTNHECFQTLRPSSSTTTPECNIYRQKFDSHELHKAIGDSTKRNKIPTKHTEP
ncbi:hypothetical protein V6N13_087923 [Hibiscus sabdariffa]